MAEMMVGAESAEPVARAAATRAASRVVLDRRPGRRRRHRRCRCSRTSTLDVRRGEIVGIAGVSGNGQDELVEVLAGQRPRRRAARARRGQALRADARADPRARGCACLPEAPLRNACVPDMTVAENIGLPRLRRAADHGSRCGVMPGRARQCATASAAIAAYRYQGARPRRRRSRRLSGGNVQRAVLARELSERASSVLDRRQPLLRARFRGRGRDPLPHPEGAQRGTAVLLVSADLDEIFALADRVLVMSEGRIVYESPIASADVAEIGRAMAGHR